jgi:hypothetical protein
MLMRLRLLLLLLLLLLRLRLRRCRSWTRPWRHCSGRGLLPAVQQQAVVHRRHLVEVCQVQAFITHLLDQFHGIT